MATLTSFAEDVEACLRRLLLAEYPHMKTSAVNKIAEYGVEGVASEISRIFEDNCKGVRKIDLLDLPGEIRNRIYGFAVTPDEPLAIGIGLDSHEIGPQLILPHGVRARSQKEHMLSIPYESRYRCCGSGLPSISQVNRQTRQETLPMFFEMNTFAISMECPDPILRHDRGPEAFANWLNCMPTEGLKSIRKLIVLCRYTRHGHCGNIYTIMAGCGKFDMNRLNLRFITDNSELSGLADFSLQE